MEKVLWTIGEVADLLGEGVTLVRYWTNCFPGLIKPKRNAKGNRLYRASDVETLQLLHYLIRDRGMTLDGAARTLKTERTQVRDRLRVLQSLQAIRAQLVEIREAL